MHCQKHQFLWPWKTLGIWYPKSNFVGYQATALYNPQNRDCPGKTRINGISNLQTPWNIYTREPQRRSFLSVQQFQKIQEKRSLVWKLHSWQWEWQELENRSATGKLLYNMQICLDPFTTNLVLHFLRVTNLLLFGLSCKRNKCDA